MHGALLMSGNHLDKIGEIGLKPALVEKRWLPTFIMICKLGLVQGRAEVLWCPGPRATAWLYVPPYQMLILRNVKIQAQQNYLPHPLPHAKALRHTSFTSSESKEAEKLSEFRTTLRNKSKTLARCENNFAWHFWREKVEYVSDAGALLKRRLRILNDIVLPWRRSALTAPNDVHSDKFSVLFRSFSQQLKAKNLFMIALLQTLQ